MPQRPQRPLLLSVLERRLLVRRHGLLGHCQQHRDHHVVAGDRGEVDDLLVVEGLLGARLGFVGDLLRGGQFGDEIVDQRFFLIHAGRTLAGFQPGENLRR